METNDNYNNDLGESPKHNVKRTRIARACDTCRRKKIKCDVDLRTPCTTCLQYEWECTFNDTAKKRGPPKGYIESLEDRLEKMESLLKNITNDGEVVHSPGNKQDMDEEAKARLKNRSKFMRYHGSSSGYHLMGDMLTKQGNEDSVDEEEGAKQPMFVIPSLSGVPDYRMRRMHVDGNDLMVVRDATADEIAAQQAEDTLETIDDLIPRSVLSALIYVFFTDAHTILSVVEKDDYLNAFEGKTAPPPAPLLTYAICTYACFLIKASDPVFSEAKLQRDDVFQILLERATSLVRKEYLKPRIVTIQALVLLCAHPTYSTSSYRNWILAGMAVRMAQDLGLHRTLSTVELSQRGKERKKHLWYSVYITDRWCCAVMGRPLAITDSDCDVDLPLIHGPEGKDNFTMFVNFVKLSGILGEILRRIYSPKAKSNGYKTRAIEQTVYSLEKILDEWFLHVPIDYKITENDIDQMKANPSLYPQNSRKVTEGGPLTVCYHAVVLLLHRPFIILEEEDKSPIVLKAIDICRSSAKQAIEIARSIPYMAIAKFGWNFAAYAVFQAALIHVYNCTNSDPKVAEEAKKYVDICIEECLAPLSKDIPAGPPLIPFLQTLSSLLQNNQDANQDMPQPPPVQRMSYPRSSQSMSSSESATTATSNKDFLQNLTGDPNQSWLLNSIGEALPLSQAAWQQLFSSAGAPYKDSSAQGAENIFMGNQPNGFYM